MKGEYNSGISTKLDSSDTYKDDIDSFIKKFDKRPVLNRKRLFEGDSDSSCDSSDAHVEKKVKIAGPPITSQSILQAFQSREYDKCLEMIETMRVSNGPIDVTTSQFLIIKAACWTMLNIKSEKTFEILGDIIKKEPKNSFAYYGLGLWQYRRADLQESIKSFATAIDLNGTQAMKRALEFKAKAKSVLDLIRDGKFS